MHFKEAVKKYAGQPLTRQLLMDLLRRYKRPFDKISELTRQNLLVPVKRGIYIPGPAAGTTIPESLLLANHLLGPSYVSSDSALSYWGLIPERVHEIISMTTNDSKTYKTAIGRFRYTRLPLPYYSFGLQHIELAPKQMILIATREKAVCDKIITTQRLKLRSIKQTTEYLLEDLRIDRTNLKDLNRNLIQDYIKNAPKADSISILVKTLQEL
jgi:hypothetical protein